MLSNLKRQLAVLLILLGFVSTINASFPEKTWRPLFALGAGFSSASHVDTSTNFPIQNPITDEFYNYSVN